MGSAHSGGPWSQRDATKSLGSLKEVLESNLTRGGHKKMRNRCRSSGFGLGHGGGLLLGDGEQVQQLERRRSASVGLGSLTGATRSSGLLDGLLRPNLLRRDRGKSRRRQHPGGAGRGRRLCHLEANRRAGRRRCNVFDRPSLPRPLSSASCV